MCRQRAGFALVLFLVFRLQLFAENRAEDKPAERAAVEHLPAERHRELQPQVCTHVPKLGSLNSRVATRLITGHMMQTIIREMA